MKKILFLIWLLLLSRGAAVFALEKPVLKVGTKAASSYDDYNRHLIYPVRLSDTIYFGVYEKFSEHFILYYKTELEHVTYNKYVENIGKLHAFSVKNSLTLKIKLNAYHSLIIKTDPRLHYDGHKALFSQASRFGYSLLLDNISFKVSYSNRYNFEEDTLFYHSIKSKIAWKMPGQQAVSYTLGCTFNFQHYFYTDNKMIFHEKPKSPFKDGSIHFEVVIRCSMIEVDKEIWDEPE